MHMLGFIAWKRTSCMLLFLFTRKEERDKRNLQYHSLHSSYFSFLYVCYCLCSKFVLQFVCFCFRVTCASFNPSFHLLVVHSSVLMHDRKKADNDRYMTSKMTTSVKWYFELSISYFPDPLYFLLKWLLIVCWRRWFSIQNNQLVYQKKFKVRISLSLPLSVWFITNS